jgi:hypothetical protein
MLMCFSSSYLYICPSCYIGFDSVFHKAVSTQDVANTVKVNSHMPCHAHAVPLPCRAALIHRCYAALLPFSDGAVSFVEVRVVAGNIRTASPTV